MNSAQAEKPPPSVKKPYKAPQLVKLGTLREMTMAIVSSGNADGQKTLNQVKEHTGRGGRNGLGSLRY